MLFSEVQRYARMSPELMRGSHQSFSTGYAFRLKLRTNRRSGHRGIGTWNHMRAVLPLLSLHLR